MSANPRSPESGEPDEAIDSLWRELREHGSGPVMRLSARQIAGLFRLFERANEQRDMIARLTAELSTARERADRAEQELAAVKAGAQR